MDKNIILVLAPHGDDGELGCGGTLARLIEEGSKVYYACFSMCEESIPDGFPKNELETEVKKATKNLGIDPCNLILKHYPVRKLPSHRQNILEDLIVIREQISPDIIFMPSSHSIHQDHKLVYDEGLRAFKHFTCFGYDLPWDTIEFTTNAFFHLSKNHVEKKCQSLGFYKTQKHRRYCQPELIFSLARVRGSQISTSYAESFEMIRMIF